MASISGGALVTGAATRLGRAMALALASAGHDVAIHYSSSEDEARSCAEEARAYGVKAVTLQADLLDRAAVTGLVPRAVEALGGPLAILINNASIFEHDTIHTATPESWDRHLGSNLYAPMFLTQAFAAQVEGGRRDENGEPVASGCIINMIDQRVRKPTPEFMTYSVAKHGLWAMTRMTAQGLAPDIRVNAIGPGPTLKGMRQSEAHFRQQREATILNRGASVKDIVQSMTFILRSQSLTGQLLCIDGGQHLGWQTPDVLGVE